MKRRARIKREGVVLDVSDGEWFADYHETHICCDCALAHKVDQRIHLGRIQSKWVYDGTETRIQRRKAGVRVVSSSQWRKFKAWEKQQKAKHR
jgi:hypothetical protein